MKKNDIFRRLDELNFDKTQYWLIAGSAMVLYGIRQETRDIDLGCTKQLADFLQTKGYPVTILEDGTRRITCGDDVEIFEDWLYDTVQILDNLPVISLDGLIEMKKFLGREKDRQDIQLIQNHLDKNWQSK